MGADKNFPYKCYHCGNALIYLTEYRNWSPVWNGILVCEKCKLEHYYSPREDDWRVKEPVVK